MRFVNVVSFEFLEREFGYITAVEIDKSGEYRINKETDKAVHLDCKTPYQTFHFWVPKKMCNRLDPGQVHIFRPGNYMNDAGMELHIIKVQECEGHSIDGGIYNMLALQPM